MEDEDGPPSDPDEEPKKDDETDNDDGETSTDVDAPAPKEKESAYPLYFERQRDARCAIHALNNALARPFCSDADMEAAVDIYLETSRREGNREVRVQPQANRTAPPLRRTPFLFPCAPLRCVPTMRSQQAGIRRRCCGRRHCPPVPTSAFLCLPASARHLALATPARCSPQR